MVSHSNITRLFIILALALGPQFAFAKPKNKKQRRPAQEENCATPSRKICDPELNPKLIKYDRIGRVWAKDFYRTANSFPTVKAFLKDHGKANDDSCFNFDKDSAEYKECETIWHAARHKAIYTDARIEKTKAIFNEARDAIRSLLKSRATCIDQVKLSFGAPPGQPDTVNIFTIGDACDGGEIHVGGFIVAADVAPHALRTALMHELGHSLTYDAVYKKNNLEESEFSKEFSCLKKAGIIRESRDSALYHGEAIADMIAGAAFWSSAKLAEDDTAVFESVSYLCDLEADEDDPHGLVEERIDRLLLVHPRARKQLGCSEAANSSLLVTDCAHLY